MNPKTARRAAGGRFPALFLVPVLTLGGAAPAAAAAGTDPAALTLEAGSTASRELVAIGRDLGVHGEARGDVVAIGGSVRVSGRVTGDVLVIHGDVELEPTAVVDGDAYVLGGQLNIRPGSRLQGRGAAYPSVGGAVLALLEAPTGGSGGSAALLAAQLGLVAAWLLATAFGWSWWSRPLLAASRQAAREPLRDFLTGLTAVLAAVLTALFVASFVPPAGAAPILGLLILAALGCKIFGTLALFHGCGAAVLKLAGRRRPLPLATALLGTVLLGALKFVPLVGTWVWTALSLVAVGTTLRHLLARREEDWGAAADLERLARLTR